MDKALSFFRVFDLALFLPGAVVYWLLHNYGLLGNADPIKQHGGTLSDSTNLLALVVTIGLIYGIGLGVHALQRFLKMHEWVKNCFGSAPDSGKDASSWYTNLGEDSRAELATYFWYMRATCWNLALSLFLVVVTLPGIVLYGSIAPTTSALIARILGLSILVLLFCYLGNDYDQALHRIMKSPRPVSGTSGPTTGG